MKVLFLEISTRSFIARIPTIIAVSAPARWTQGQQRTAALALKLSELEIIKMFVSSTPILILDDVFSELDKTRRLSLVSAMKGAQIFITCTDKNMIGEEIDVIGGTDGAEFYCVNSGNIVKDA